MENLVNRLRQEAGLTEEQSLKVIAIIKDFMDKENMDIDWNKFFKGKYQDFIDRANDLFDDVSDQAQEYSEKLTDKVGDLAHQAKEKASHLFNKGGK
ncbi:YtxH domain-containing protein [Dysgonomonas sp. 216]|uniref:hypothetical protein n=1 Tax=Dysgonomonas sp. 216 TaxID=2302934 RepID=UPI0013D7F251|nr:hypothetical protein [Dysgonomonas sp. 216]NDW18092.1 YtxH domain-containing protein [Dysgonomonas sp. 216]